VLVFKRWHHQAMTRVENLFYKVTLRLRGIPAHARNLATLHKLLSPTWSNIRPTTTTLAKVDLGRMTVAAWCIHLGLILVKKSSMCQRQRWSFLGGCRPSSTRDEVIFHKQPTLWYCVFIDILEIEDWHTPFVSSSSGGSYSDVDIIDY
jgi:hypothetical protein